jgi:hypothetical protein
VNEGIGEREAQRVAVLVIAVHRHGDAAVADEGVVLLDVEPLPGPVEGEEQRRGLVPRRGERQGVRGADLELVRDRSACA